MRVWIVHVLHLPPHPVADAQQYEQEQRHGQFGRRYREPDPRDARQPRQHEEAESHQHDAPKHGEPRRKPSALDALVVADRDDVDSEKGIPGGEERQAAHGDCIGRGVGRQEQPHDPRAEQPCEPEYRQPAGERRAECHPERIPAAPHQPCAVVVADDRLCRLDDAVVDHEDDREDIAGDAVRRHAVLADVADERIVAHDHQARDRQFAQQRREPDVGHVAQVTGREAQALVAGFELHEMQRAAAAQHVPQHHARAYDIADARCDGRACEPPPEFEDEEVVEYDVYAGRHDVARHGEPGRAVEPHDEHQDVEDGQRREEEREPHEVFARGNHQLGRRAQQQQQRFVAMDQQGAEQRDQQGRYDQRLRDVDLGHAAFALCQVHRRHHRAAHAEHQPEPRAEREERGGEVDCRQCVAADAAAYEYPVGDDEHRREDHPHDRGEKKAAEEFADRRAFVIDTVA